MRIHVFSDLHLEFERFSPFYTDADVIVIAGDIHIGTAGVDWILEYFPGRDVVYVLGNHEGYGFSLPALINTVKDRTIGTRIRLLENEAITIGDTLFVGATFWTDFELFSNAKLAKQEAEQSMADFRLVEYDPENRPMTPDDTLMWHHFSKRWIFHTLQTSQAPKKVVVTHHAPARISIHERYRYSIISAAFTSPLDDAVAASGADLWVHGHMHDPADYHLNQTRVVCNPRGYPHERDNGFDPRLVIEL